MSSEYSSCVEKVFRSEAENLLAAAMMRPEHLNLTFCKLHQLMSLANRLGLSIVAEKIQEELGKVYPLGTLVKIVDGTFRTFEGVVNGKVDANGWVDVAVDIFGRDTVVPVSLDCLQVRQ